MVMAALAAITAAGAVNAFAAKPQGGSGGGPRFALSGKVEELWPGAQVPLKVTVENPYRFDILLTSLSVGVASASPSCPASVLHVSPFDGEVRITGRGQGTVELMASLDSEAPDGCQGVEWALTYTATARRA